MLIVIGYVVAPIALVTSADQRPDAAWLARSLPLQLVIPTIACIAVAMVFQPQPGRAELGTFSRLGQFLANAVYIIPFGIAMRYIAYEVVPWDYDHVLCPMVDPPIFLVTLFLVIAIPVRLLAHLRRVRLGPMPDLLKYLIFVTCAVGGAAWIFVTPARSMLFSEMPPLVFLYLLPIAEFIYWCYRGFKMRGSA